ncbi:MAG TPA: hypothetical protein HPP83_12040, partial [Candidatus Hydrogenedentes bacterium]|nr:hypothetical protein [Candidatus Hydrogenedentota bacterium]
DVTITLCGHAAMAGRVVHADTGEPITDAELFLAHSHIDNVVPEMLAESRSVGRLSDLEGRFELSRLDVGDVTVIAKASGFEPGLTNGLVLVEHETLTDVEIRLSPSDEEPITGRVCDAEGNPIPRASVYVEESLDMRVMDRNVATTTDADGAFTIEDPWGNAQFVSVWHPGYAPASTYAAQGGTVVLEPEARVEGIVLDGNMPVAGMGIQVHLRRQLPVSLMYFATTDTRGVFSIGDLPSGTLDINTTLSPDYPGFVCRTVDAIAGQTTHIVLRFERGTSRLEGRITYHGKVAPGEVELCFSTPSGEQKHRTDLEPDGSYELTDLPSGEARLRYRPWKAHSKYRSLTIEEGVSMRLDIDFSGQGCIRGRVSGIRSDDGCLASVWVFPLHVDLFQPSGEVRSCAAVFSELKVGYADCQTDGSFMVSDLEPGTYNLLVVHDTMGWMGFYPENQYISSVVTIEGNETVTANFDFR